MIPRLVDRRREPETTVPGLLAEAQRWTANLGAEGWVYDLVLIDDPEMRGINGRFRDKDAATDVLSFSYLLESGDTPPDLPGGDGGAWTDLWLDNLQKDDVGASVGEVILAPGFITQRCAENGWSLEAEMPMLVVHGCLHLLGWDHMEEEQGRAMRALEQKHLAACGLEHPLAGESKGRS